MTDRQTAKQIYDLLKDGGYLKQGCPGFDALWAVVEAKEGMETTGGFRYAPLHNTGGATQPPVMEAASPSLRVSTGSTTLTGEATPIADAAPLTEQPSTPPMTQREFLCNYGDKVLVFLSLLAASALLWKRKEVLSLLKRFIAVMSSADELSSGDGARTTAYIADTNGGAPRTDEWLLLSADAKEVKEAFPDMPGAGYWVPGDKYSDDIHAVRWYLLEGATAAEVKEWKAKAVQNNESGSTPSLRGVAEATSAAAGTQEQGASWRVLCCVRLSADECKWFANNVSGVDQSDALDTLADKQWEIAGCMSSSTSLAGFHARK